MLTDSGHGNLLLAHVCGSCKAVPLLRLSIYCCPVTIMATPDKHCAATFVGNFHSDGVRAKQNTTTVRARSSRAAINPRPLPLVSQRLTGAPPNLSATKDPSCIHKHEHHECHCDNVYDESALLTLNISSGADSCCGGNTARDNIGSN